MFVEGTQDCVWVTALHQRVKLLYAQASPVKQRSCNSLNPKSMTAHEHARYSTQPLLKNIRTARQIVRVRPDLLNIRPSGELIHHPPDFAAFDLVIDLCRLISFPGSAHGATGRHWASEALSAIPRSSLCQPAQRGGPKDRPGSPG
jgi:hypothetical protein